MCVLGVWSVFGVFGVCAELILCRGLWSVDVVVVSCLNNLQQWLCLRHVQVSRGFVSLTDCCKKNR